jgi:hypothetical protein
MTKKGFLITLGIALVVALAGVIPLMGLPGAFVLILGSPVASLIYGPNLFQTVDNDAMWPMAIFATFLWPISFVAGYALAWGVFKGQKRLVKWCILIAVTLVWASILTVYFVGVAPKETTV